MIEKRTKNGWVLDEICGQMYVYFIMYTVYGVEIYEWCDFYVAHSIFLSTEHTDTHGFFPPKRGIQAHYGQRFYLGVSCLRQEILEEIFEKIYGLWPEINIFSFNLISLKYFLRSRNIF